MGSSKAERKADGALTIKVEGAITTQPAARAAHFGVVGLKEAVVLASRLKLFANLLDGLADGHVASAAHVA